MLVLSHRHNLEKQGCYPSYKTIAEDCGVSEATAKRAVQALGELGEIKRIERKNSDGTNTSNFYVLPKFEEWYLGIRKNSRGANGTPPPTSNRPQGGIPQTRELGIELGSIEEETPAASIILLAIKESERTGERADDILARLRVGA